MHFFEMSGVPKTASLCDAETDKRCDGWPINSLSADDPATRRAELGSRARKRYSDQHKDVICPLQERIVLVTVQYIGHEVRRKLIVMRISGRVTEFIREICIS
jgi:hypothetical protein